jgi:hypothetical protein
MCLEKTGLRAANSHSYLLIAILTELSLSMLKQALLNGTPTQTEMWRSGITPTADEKRHWAAAEVAYTT